MGIKKIGNKIISVFILLIGITFLSFLLSYYSPGDPATMILKKSGMRVSQELIDQKREELGLNEPFLIQYATWIKHSAMGDLGISYKSGKAVKAQLLTAMPYTLSLAGGSFLLIILLSTPIGIICAYKENGSFDKAVRVIIYLLSAMPSFFIGVVFIYVFSLKFGLLPVVSKGNTMGLVGPSIVLALTLQPWYIRQIKGITMSELQKEYVAGLRFRGVSEARILFVHVLRNCAYQIITLFGMAAGGLLGGAVVIESIFTWPGLGKLAVDAITYRDYPVIQGFVLWMALIYLLINGLVDLLGFLLDPRVRKSRGDME